MFKTPATAARRTGFLAGGLALLAGDALLVCSMVEQGLGHAIRGLPHLTAHAVLLAMWPLAILVGLAVYLMTARRPALVREPAADTAFAVPAFAAALCLPATIHLALFAMLGAQLRDFDAWAAPAVALTAFAHFWFASYVGARAGQLARGELAITPRRIYWTTVRIAVIPGLLLLGIPCVLVALTGLPILPLMHAMERYAAYDRGTAWIPRAQVLA